MSNNFLQNLIIFLVIFFVITGLPILVPQVGISYPILFSLLSIPMFVIVPLFLVGRSKEKIIRIILFILASLFSFAMSPFLFFVWIGMGLGGTGSKYDGLGTYSLLMSFILLYSILPLVFFFASRRVSNNQQIIKKIILFIVVITLLTAIHVVYARYTIDQRGIQRLAEFQIEKAQPDIYAVFSPHDFYPSSIQEVFSSTLGITARNISLVNQVSAEITYDPQKIQVTSFEPTVSHFNVGKKEHDVINGRLYMELNGEKTFVHNEANPVATIQFSVINPGIVNENNIGFVQFPYRVSLRSNGQTYSYSNTQTITIFIK